MNPLRCLASSGPGTPLCKSPRPGSPVSLSLDQGYGSMRRASDARAGPVGLGLDTLDPISGADRDGESALHGQAQGPQHHEPVLAGMSRSRVYALIAVCTLSVGSHFAMYQLGPLKSRLHREMGTSNAQFSLLIAAYNLNSTWTPLVAGLFVARFGTGWSSIATTACIVIGQLILLLGVTTSHLITMTLGLFIFGLGVTPLAVVQETLVARLSPSNHLGISLALGLVSGKLASFVSSLVSLPLAEKYGDATPFSVSVVLCAASFTANLARLAFGWGSEAGEGEVKGKRKFSWRGVSRLGDVFWVYILLNIFSGMIWAPFLHLSANIVKVRYGLSDGFAATQAAILLSGALILYPVTGFITDRLNPSTPRTTFRLLFLSSCLTLLCYAHLALPPSLTHTPMPGLILFTLGHGMSTLLLVILVPRFLPSQLVPLGLGLHKSMEMASSALSQTLAGVWLDGARGSPNPGTGEGQGQGEGEHDETSENGVAVAGLVRAFLLINVLQLGCVLALWKFESVRRREAEERVPLETAEEYERLPMNDLPALDSDSEFEDDEDEGPTGDVKRTHSSKDSRTRVGFRSSSFATYASRSSRSKGASRSSDEAAGSDTDPERSARADHDVVSVGADADMDGAGDGEDGDGLTGPTSALARDAAERGRSRAFLVASIGWLVLVWTVFLVDAYVDLL